MKQEKLEMMIRMAKMHIEFEQKNIDRCMEQIKDKAKSNDHKNIAMFMIGNVKELQEAIDRQEKYREQLDMLEYLMSEEEEN